MLLCSLFLSDSSSLRNHCYAVNKERGIEKIIKKCRKFEQFPAFFGRGSKERSDGIAKDERPGFSPLAARPAPTLSTSSFAVKFSVIQVS